MADVVNSFLAQATENLNENATNTTKKPPSSPEGMAVAYGCLILMALLPIFFGSYRSVVYHKEKVSFFLTLTHVDLTRFSILLTVLFAETRKDD